MIFPFLFPISWISTKIMNLDEWCLSMKFNNVIHLFAFLNRNTWEKKFYRALSDLKAYSIVNSRQKSNSSSGSYQSDEKNHNLHITWCITQIMKYGKKIFYILIIWLNIKHVWVDPLIRNFKFYTLDWNACDSLVSVVWCFTIKAVFYPKIFQQIVCPKEIFQK